MDIIELDQHLSDEERSELEKHELAIELLEQAFEAKTKKQAEKYALQALDVDPMFTEAELFLVDLRYKGTTEYEAELEELLHTAESELKMNGLPRCEIEGSYYAIYETRPYMRVYRAYLDCLVDRGKFQKAIEACKDILIRNEDDNMGVRYTLMALYALMEEKDAAEQLYKQFEENSSFMLLPLIALAYKQDDTDRCHELLQCLCQQNKGARKGFKNLANMDEFDLEEVRHIEAYAPYSEDELLLAYADFGFLYGSMHDFIPWVNKNIPSTRPKAEKDKS